MAKINLKEFSSGENLYLVPPYIKDPERVIEVWKAQGLEGHVFICSSGTTSQEKLKTYALSKKSILENAKAVNEFLGATKDDIWLSSLPPFHIGGLSIYARSYLLGNEPIELTKKWCAEDCLVKASYFSVVPLQLYEMVQKKIKAPLWHKGVFVGGDFLADHLRNQALELGWKVIVTYGMTEFCSQIASEFVDENFDGKMRVLPIHKIVGKAIESKSLFTSCILIGRNSHKVIPAEQPYIPNDKFEYDKNRNSIRPLGRSDDSFKHKGRLFNKFEVLNLVQEILIGLNLLDSAQLILEEDPNYGRIPVVLVTKENLKCELEEKLSASKYLKTLIFEVRVVKELRKTAVGKIPNFC